MTANMEPALLAHVTGLDEHPMPNVSGQSEPFSSLTGQAEFKHERQISSMPCPAWSQSLQRVQTITAPDTVAAAGTAAAGRRPVGTGSSTATAPSRQPAPPGSWLHTAPVTALRPPVRHPADKRAIMPGESVTVQHTQPHEYGGQAPYKHLSPNFLGKQDKPQAVSQAALGRTTAASACSNVDEGCAGLLVGRGVL